MVTELGLPVLESSTRFSKFNAPTDYEHKLKNWKLATHMIQSGIVLIGSPQSQPLH